MFNIKRALISVSDKGGLDQLAKTLVSFGVEIVSTGGTASYLRQLGIPVVPIEQITGNREAFGGRMKTLSFEIGSALLYRRDNPQDKADASQLGIVPIDLVVVNLYPFIEKAMDGQSSPAELLESVDIGGPTMIRAAAKNHAHVAVLSSVAQYESFSAKFTALEGKVDLEMSRRLAVEAFQLTAKYDQWVSTVLEEKLLPPPVAGEAASLRLPLMGEPVPLRYGENPHQAAVLYPSDGEGVARAAVIQGKALSYNNLLDADAAWKCSRDLHHEALAWIKNPCAITIIKHMNPCGAVVGDASSSLQLLQEAWNTDATSSFGSIISFSSSPSLECLRWLKDKFVEVIILPEGNPELLDELQTKKNLRVLVLPPLAPTREKVLRSVGGGLLVQEEDVGPDPDWVCPTKTPFPSGQMFAARLGVMLTKYLKSNAIAIVKGSAEKGSFTLVSSGVGQTNRVESLAQLALPKALQRHGSDGQMVPFKEMVLVSDGFFPFPDSVLEAHRAGLRLMVQPGGSMRDKEVLAACDDYGISMIMTGRRHFRH